jgi:hypothetical protein
MIIEEEQKELFTAKFEVSKIKEEKGVNEF